MHLLDIDYPMVRAAIENHRRYGIGYWDSLILASAQRFQCPVLYTEDLNHGQDYGGVRARNPFLD
jgi:predicted nucleic acid-binding protein